jgi:hypothetical protein
MQRSRQQATAKSSGLQDLVAEAIARELEYEFARNRSLRDLSDQTDPDDPLRRRGAPRGYVTMSGQYATRFASHGATVRQKGRSIGYKC